jgi:A/G-specific adenine glycosylase
MHGAQHSWTVKMYLAPSELHPDDLWGSHIYNLATRAFLAFASDLLLLTSSLTTSSIPLTPSDQRVFRAALLRWFRAHRRSLPWRDTRDPYRIWISEIMLQQTRVGAVLERYAEFLRRFPDMRSLAAARLQHVLAAWSGLGYYRRARALHRAAQVVARDHGGCLPRTAEALRRLPGIGLYTANAIASIAFDEPCAVVDGNVERVLRRLLGWSGKPVSRIWDAAQQLLSPRAPGNFNQAVMELGALVCLPGVPRCGGCPVRRFCATRGPLRRPPSPPRRTAETTYALALQDSRVYLVRRSRRESLMPGMWELPSIPANHLLPEFTLRHAITVTDHTAHVCRVSPAEVRGGRWFRFPSAATLPLTGLARRILRHASLI